MSIHLLIGRQSKLPPGGQQIDLHITKNPYLTQQEVEKILDKTSTQTLSNYESIHEHFEANAGINIKNVSTAKKNYDSNTQLMLC